MSRFFPISLMAALFSVAAYAMLPFASAQLLNASDGAERLDRLEQRVYELEQVEEIKRTVLQYGRLTDRILTYDRDEDIWLIINDMHTQDGVIKHFTGVWGPKKEEMFASIKAFAESIDWAVHYYTNPEVAIDHEDGSAQYRALELIAVKFKDGHSGWTWVANQSKLRKTEHGWKFELYGPSEGGRLRYDWPDFPKETPSWMQDWPAHE
ncbi:MAG: nuclear transport factor 2 family protein [Pseudomonadota bacterium]